MRYFLALFLLTTVVGLVCARGEAQCASGCYAPGQWCHVNAGCPGDCVCLSRTFGGEGVCVAVGASQ